MQVKVMERMRQGDICRWDRGRVGYVRKAKSNFSVIRGVMMADCEARHYGFMCVRGPMVASVAREKKDG